MTDVSCELFREVQSLLHREARLLDERNFTDWLDLYTEDAVYKMPVRESVQPRGKQLNTQRIVEDDLAFDLVNEDKAGLTIRVRRLETGLAHVETPVPVTARLVTNIEVEQLPGGELLAMSMCLAYEMRHERSRQAPESHFVARRDDWIRREDGRLRIRRRRSVLASAVLDRPIAMVI